MIGHATVYKTLPAYYMQYISNFLEESLIKSYLEGLTSYDVKKVRSNDFMNFFNVIIRPVNLVDDRQEYNKQRLVRLAIMKLIYKKE